MNHSSASRVAATLAALWPVVLLACLACGGRSGSLPSQGPGTPGDPGPALCAPLDCPPEAPFDPNLCACILSDDAGLAMTVDSSVQCPPIACPVGTLYEMLQDQCVCVAYPVGDDGGQTPDAWIGYDAPYAYDSWVAPQQDAPYYVYDAPYYVYDSPYVNDAPYCGYYNYCGPGYVLNAACMCVACTQTCPIGETPTAGCTGCQPCATTCPVGFKNSYACGCVPDGVDAGPPPPPPDSGPDAGVTCQLEGYISCAAGSWCSLGTCPDGKTQYGCYCNPDGTATCNLSCPAPPSCSIPGLGNCASGQTCVYGTCSSASASLLVCNCQYNGGSAYCSTYSCADGGPTWLPDSGPSVDAGPSCWLQGYTQCPVGQYCELGTCPSGAAYGCTCNADGTTNCNLACAPPGPCVIPGEGTCPYGQQCTFGTCDGGATSLLTCSCYGGSASCYTNPCP